MITKNKKREYKRTHNEYIQFNETLNKKLDKDLFYWIIGGLLTISGIIVSIWWHLSYSTIHNLPSRVQEVESSVEKLEERLNQICESEKK